MNAPSANSMYGLDSSVVSLSSVPNAFDEVRAGGRIPLIVGRGLTAKAREALEKRYLERR